MMTPPDASLWVEQHATSGQPPRALAALTSNQKKKRRQRLAKLSKAQTRASATSSQSDSMLVGSEASSITYVPGSSCHDQHAAPEDHPVRVQQPTGVSAPSTQAAAASMTLLGHMHDLASTEGPAPVSNNDCMSASFQPAMQLTEQKALTLPAATAVVMPMASTAAIPFLLARHRPASSQQPSSVCRQDMSGAARLMQANMSTGTSASSSSVAVTPPETAASTPQDLPKRHKKVFVHGNYKAYYGYRLGTELSEDPRLQVFDRRWFHNKRCLDIGCNEGVVTLGVVQRFAPLSMLGVDIDEGLVKAACRALSKQRTEASQLHQRLLRHAAAELGERPAAQRKAASAAVRAFANTYFTCEDFANSQHASQSLDNIMCLSVTKWVHLNGGDEGLKKLFAKVADALAPGGWFILEPQPWRSYKQARRKQEMAATTFAKADMLQLRPEAFPDYLQQELGFILVRQLQVATSSAGFNRPVYLFQKPI